jgi:hypothetical protein
MKTSERLSGVVESLLVNGQVTLAHQLVDWIRTHKSCWGIGVRTYAYENEMEQRLVESIEVRCTKCSSAKIFKEDGHE